MAAKDFGLIADDYAFFMAHATEAEEDVADYERELAGFADGRTAIRMLDFGCGSGEFTERFLSTMDWPKRSLGIALVEPVGGRREEALQRLARFSDRPLSVAEDWPSDTDSQFDLILVNHVLYYVDDLETTLRRLIESLAPAGALRLAIAGWDNMLLKLWQAGFALLGQPVPYYAAEDVAGALAGLGVSYRRTKSYYRICFPDSSENRAKIARFLFANYLEQLPLPKLLCEFDRYAQKGRIEVDTHSDHFAVDVA